MKDEKKIFNILTIGSIVVDTLLFAFGLYLLIDPTLSAKVIGYVMGLLLIVVGIAAIIKFFIKIKNNGFFVLEICYGILNVIAGIFMMSNPLALANILTVGLGVFLIISAVFKVGFALQFRKFKEETWLFSFIIAILTLIIGILIIVNPLSGVIMTATYVGVMIMIYSAMDVLQQFLFRKRVKEISEILFK